MNDIKPNETPTRKACLQLVHIKKDYYVDKKPFTAIHDLSLNFPDRGFVAILGHSGSGKTTLLNIIGGLDHYTEGDMLIDGRSTKDYKDRDWDNYRNKRIGFVFQSYNLIPHLTVLQNVVMSLQLGGLNRKQREEKALAVLEKVGLSEYVKKRPNQLSGGQMQRVAIARALVNDPDIILADEPTGALDSATSVQVMDLIREVGKDRCVIMVTHNRELADAYADRIIEMKDGRIENDTDPLIVEKEEADLNPKTGKKSAMSFWTALGSSARNIRTKKGRTTLTAIACSFGIIGVALVLATSNGFSKYVGDVEVSIASSVPISINPVSYKINTIEEILPEEFPKDKNVLVYDSSTTLTTPVYNNFSNEYFEYLNRITNDPKCYAYGSAMSIMYNRNGLNFHFTAKKADGTIGSINQYSSAGSFGSAINTVTSLPATIIHEIYGDEEHMGSLYDTIEGRYPKAADEMAIVVDRYNRIDFATLRKLGYFSSDATFKSLTPEEKSISFADILYKDEAHPGRVEYKCYRNSDYYQLPKNPAEVDGILESTNYQSHTNINITTSGSIETKDFKATVTSDPGTAMMRYVQDPGAAKVFSDDATYKPIKMKIVGVLRPTPSSYIQLMPASLAYTSKLTKIMAADIEEGTSSYRLGEIQRRNWFVPRSDNPDYDGLANLQKLLDTVTALINSSTEATRSTNLTQAISVLTSGLPNSFAMFSAMQKNSQKNIGDFLSCCKNLGAEFESVSLLNEDDIMNYFIRVTQIGIPEYFNNDAVENIMDLVAYANSYSLITSILIFPASLTTKDTIHRYLDDWNAAHENNEIVYSDIMNDIMGGLSTMIEVISAVLIVFASISLVVSSVMTAIITYVSVIERTKEIGVLRACGARKKDVSRLFEAECVIIGGIAGLIGIVFTIVVCFPINAILNHTFPGNNLSSIAQLNPWHAVLLLVISIVLAFLSGFIPARLAAKKDPVVCLRTE